MKRPKKRVGSWRLFGAALVASSVGLGGGCAANVEPVGTTESSLESVSPADRAAAVDGCEGILRGTETFGVDRDGLVVVFGQSTQPLCVDTPVAVYAELRFRGADTAAEAFRRLFGDSDDFDSAALEVLAQHHAEPNPQPSDVAEPNPQPSDVGEPNPRPSDIGSEPNPQPSDIGSEPNPQPSNVGEPNPQPSDIGGERSSSVDKTSLTDQEPNPQPSAMIQSMEQAAGAP
ncbi:MAG: hypothetical protein AAGF12_31520 [Myxococcota bacterium]